VSAVLADSGVNFSRVGLFLNDPANWWGPNGLLVELRQHVYYTLIAVILGLVIALPAGLWIGHTGRGKAVVGGLANGLRAVPALGFVVLLVLLLAPRIHWRLTVPGLLGPGVLPYFVAVEVVLIVLAIPPILTNTYAGVQNVDPAVRDAAVGVGMTGRQVVLKVELPIALPLIASGVRSATLQVIATATIAAYAPFLGGLGAPIISGTQQLNDPRYGYPAMVSAGILVAVLAMVADGLLHLVERLSVSPGLRHAGGGRFRTRSALPEQIAGEVT
jgi:osmoprotectant transport system permease protein